MNLFWSTRALTAEREDHLTEFLAAALQLVPSFRDSYLRLVLGPASSSDRSPLEIAQVETQVNYKGTTCCPDMILHLSNGRIIACEHKLDAVETVGPARDSRGQLERYLDLPIDGLLYFRTCWKAPSEAVLRHPKYLHPSHRDHFLWRDLYPLLAQSEDPFLAWLREGFERLGLTPPHPSVGEMSGPSIDVNRQNRRNFAKLWGPTRSLAHGLGWKVRADSIVELYLTDNAHSIASWVFISPAMADRFLIRVTPRPGKLELVNERMSSIAQSLPQASEVGSRAVMRKGGATEVVDVVTTLRDVLGPEEVSVEVLEERLRAFVEPLLCTLQT